MERQRGQLTSLTARQYHVALVDDAVASGARKVQACEVIGLSIRSYQRWQQNGVVIADKRPDAIRPEPKNKLTEEERQQVLDIANAPEFAELPPSQIVPILADGGKYIASESSFYRILKAENMLMHRGRAKQRRQHAKPTTYRANKANQVWSWDISYIPSRVIGQHYYLYMIEDIYSRKIVGAEVYECESGEYGAELLQRATWAEKCVKPAPVLHSDNGAPMKSLTMQAKMADLGITGSRSRPRVSNDNPYSESLFRTVKYHPRWPSEGFESLDTARDWVNEFVHWYNEEHRHSRINFVTPVQRHNGLDHQILEQRKQVYQNGKLQHPERWSGNTRNWEVTGVVELNPEKKPEAA